METSWYGLFELPPDETFQVRAGDMQEFLRQQMMGVTNPGLTVTTMREQEARPDQDQKEVFCTIRWTRDDIADLIEDISGVQLDREAADNREIESIIDDVISEVQRALRDGSISEGWDIIRELMPDEAIEAAKDIAGKQVLGITLEDEAKAMRGSSDQLSSDTPAQGLIVKDGR